MNFENVENNIFLLTSKQEARPMTIIIGALCDGVGGAVFCSDLITIVNYPPVVLENTPKITSINHYAVVLTSGNVPNFLFLEEATINATKLS